MEDIVLQVSDLYAGFHTKTGILHAVNGISYSLSKGETVAIVGESGCGKSCSVLSLVQLLPERAGFISGGKVLYHDMDLLKLSKSEIRKIRGKDISIVFQDPLHSLNPVMRIGDQIEEKIIRHMGCSKEAATKQCLEVLDMVQIPDPYERMKCFPHQLSGGMRQRVMIAIALACYPQIIIADEPTTALDVTIQAEIIDLMKSLKEQLGMSLIWISHDLGVVAQLADKVLVMYGGRIVEEASVFELFDKPSHPYTRGLLGSLPNFIDFDRNKKLDTIEGSPLDLFEIPNYCFFSSRCKFACEKCLQHYPKNFCISKNHNVSCWVDPETGVLR